MSMDRYHPQALELLGLMRELAARHYPTGWGKDFEYILYESVLTGPIKVNSYWIDRMDIDRVRALSERVNGWWDETPNGMFKFVPLQDWHDQFILQPSIF